MADSRPNSHHFTETNLWSRVETTGPPFIPRSFHAAVVLGSRLYIFGGDRRIGDGDVLNAFISGDYIIQMQYFDMETNVMYSVEDPDEADIKPRFALQATNVCNTLVYVVGFR